MRLEVVLDDGLSRNLKAAGEAGPRIVAAGLLVAADVVVAEARRRVDAQSASMTGRLRNGFVVSRPRIHPFGAEVDVGNNAPHAAPTEFGRKPGTTPPFRPLERWVRRSGLFDLDPAEGIMPAAFALSRKIGERRGGKGPPAAVLREYVARRYRRSTLKRYALNRLVRSIQKKIHDHGTEARPFLGPALSSPSPGRAFEDAVSRATARGG